MDNPLQKSQEIHTDKSTLEFFPWIKILFVNSSAPKKSNHFSISSHLLMKEAERRGWKTKILDYEKRLVAFFPEPDEFDRSKDPNKVILCQGSATELGTAHGRAIAKDKMLTYVIANYFGIPTPECLLYLPERIDFPVDLLKLLQRHRQLVVKPTDCSCGNGVSMNITDLQSLQTALEYAKQYSSQIVIQSYISGNDYRILVLNGHVIAATWRRPAFVIGDGGRTIRQLIESKNVHPWRGMQQEKPLQYIDLDEAEAFIGTERLESVPVAGCHIQVISVASISRGGEPHDVTEVIHESIQQLAVKISNAAQLTLCGVDMIIAGDISKPIGSECQATLIEINAAPFIRMHHFPSDGGFPRNVSGAILDEIIRRRNISIGISTIPINDHRLANGGKYFAQILANPEEFLSLSHGEREYYAKNYS